MGHLVQLSKSEMRDRRVGDPLLFGPLVCQGALNENWSQIFGSFAMRQQLGQAVPGNDCRSAFMILAEDLCGDTRVGGIQVR